MKQGLSILFLIVLLACQNKAPKESSIAIDLTSNIVTPKHYIVTKTNSPIVVDGIADEPNWQSALFTDLFMDIEGVKKPKYNTKVKMLWDESCLYVFAQLEEPHVWGNLKQHDTIIYLNNDFEVFIDPSGTTRNYREIEINALGTVWDLSLDKPYRSGGKANNHWNLNELKSAVHVNGTLNDPTDTDSLWTMEMAIPMNALTEVKKPRTLPKEGEQWRINFSRVEWDYDIVNGTYQRKKEEDGTQYQREYNWVWSPQKVVNMHEPEKWGVLQFTDEIVSKNISYIEDKNMRTKQLAYALFRQTNYGSLKKLLKEKVGHVQNFKVKYSGEESLSATFYKTNFGFEFKLKSPQSGQKFIINEQGLLKTLP